MRGPVLRRPSGDDGSAVLLVPAGVLVLVVLASIALDAAIVFAAQRQLADAAGAAANDTVTAALDADAFYGCGAIRLDTAAVDRTARASLAARTSDIAPGSADVRTGTTPDGRPTVTVRLTGTVRTVFRPALGARATETVTASATATAERQQDGTVTDCRP